MAGVVRPHPKPGPKKKIRRWKTPRCTYGKGRCKRPQAVDTMCRSHARQEADRRWSLAVREAGECEAAIAEGTWMPRYEGGGKYAGVACGGVLQAAHGFPRTYAKTRHVLLNGFCVCAGHHRWFTSHPLEWTQFMIERLGATVYEELRQLALSPVHNFQELSTDVSRIP